MPRLPALKVVGGAPTLDPDATWVVEAYERYFKYVWALVGRLGIPTSAVDDVVQEVFLILHRRRHEFRGDAHVRTWLHGIAVNVARRHREQARRREHLSVDDEPVAHDRSPESVASDHVQLQRLDRMLAELSDEQREVFVLSEIAELTAPEVAALLEIKLNTVYSRLRLARRHLERRIEEERTRGDCDGAA
jgi:RNA polymerase sigma-70 factor (ECF subfamily)